VVDVVRGSVCGVRVAVVTQVFVSGGTSIVFPVVRMSVVAFFGVVK
jgi:hypothetical protein